MKELKKIVFKAGLISFFTISIIQAKAQSQELTLTRALEIALQNNLEYKTYQL